VFVNNITVTYTDDIASATFDDKGFRKVAKTSKGGEGGSSGGGGTIAVGGGITEEMIRNAQMMMQQGPQPIPSKSPTKSGRERDTSASRLRGSAGRAGAPGTTAPSGPSPEDMAEGKKAGFVVVMSGYLPYKDAELLLDPTGASDDKTKWGVITRLMNLDKYFDSNSPFELYKKTRLEHFQLKIGDVDVASKEMPSGIGVLNSKKKDDLPSKKLNSDEDSLLDPMTKEVISKVPQYDQNGKIATDKNGKELYKVNDQWFTLKAKFIWREAAGAESAKKGEASGSSGSKDKKPVSPSPKTSASKSSSAGKKTGGSIKKSTKSIGD
jgi:hypothetical protein